MSVLVLNAYGKSSSVTPTEFAITDQQSSADQRCFGCTRRLGADCIVYTILLMIQA